MKNAIQGLSFIICISKNNKIVNSKIYFRQVQSVPMLRKIVEKQTSETQDLQKGTKRINGMKY